MSLALREEPAVALKSAAMIRERCRNIAAAVTAGQSRHFRIDRTRLDDAAALVAAVTRRRYPDLDVPYHSRWRHFETGGIDRKVELDRALAGRSVADRARARIDLTVTSALLDAGAGAAWGFFEAESGQRYTRSEGLAVASFRAFMRGAFSARPDDPLRVDASALAAMGAATLASLFQAGTANPLLGLEGRAALLRRLGSALVAQRDAFGNTARPGALFDTLTAQGTRRAVSASTLLEALLDGLGPIWLTGSVLDGVPLGDVWRHPHAGGGGSTAGWVPLHKLSQWLAYSLIEPLQWAGYVVTDLDDLTGLAEYRNGGLFLDTGVLTLRDPTYAMRGHDVGSPLVVEWRALTIALLDELASNVRRRLKLDAASFPLARLLKGGTWAAGRSLAAKLRSDGSAPIRVISDGSVF